MFLDRIFYHMVYLPKIGKAFALKIPLEEIIKFYKLPIGWAGVILIAIGVAFIWIGKEKRRNK